LVFGVMGTTAQSGMTIFELMWFVLIVAGASEGGIFGYSHFGVWGVVLGVPLGGGVGFLAGVVLTFLLALVFKALFGGTILRPRAPINRKASNDKT
jgi:hypothetical protein